MTVQKAGKVVGPQGVGIDSVSYYYLATNTTTLPKHEDTGWSTTAPILTRDKRYMYMYIQVILENGDSYLSNVSMSGVYGDDGTANITYGTDELTSGVSPLETGTIYCQYV